MRRNLVFTIPTALLVALFAACTADREPRPEIIDVTPTEGQVDDQPAEDVPPATAPEAPADPDGMPPAAAPDGDRNLARFGGYGDIDFGTAEAEMAQAWGGELKTLGKDMNAQCFFMTPSWNKVPAALSFMIGDGKFVRYGTENAVLVAPGGGKIGMTKAEIGKLYANVVAEPHKYSDGEYLRIKDAATGNTLIFETDAKGDDAKVTEWRVGMEPHVGYVEGCA